MPPQVRGPSSGSCASTGVSGRPRALAALPSTFAFQSEISTSRPRPSVGKLSEVRRAIASSWAPSLVSKMARASRMVSEPLGPTTVTAAAHMVLSRPYHLLVMGLPTQLPVPVTEFVGFVGNVAKWAADTADDEEVQAEIDTITPSYVLVNEHSQSVLMQHVLRKLYELAGFARIRSRLTIVHLSGESNRSADLASRQACGADASFTRTAKEAVLSGWYGVEHRQPTPHRVQI